MRRFLLSLVSLLVLFTANAPAQDKSGGGITPMCVSGCLSGFTIIGSTFVPGSFPTEAGPFTFEVTFFNQGSSSALLFVTCTPSSSQITCDGPPDEYNVDPNTSVAVPIQFSTLGRGTYSLTVTGTSGPAQVSTGTGSGIHVVGAPLATHLFPLDSSTYGALDTLRAEIAHPSGINVSSILLKIDGVSKPKTVTTISSAQVRVTAQPTGLAAGYHTWETYACANNGRCESTFSTILAVGAPTIFSLDDSVPAPATGEGAYYGTLPGGVPLPPAELRGCPLGSDDPEIRLTSPASYLSQPASATYPGGLIFVASVQPAEKSLVINALTIDHTPNQSNTCATWGFLQWTDYNWDFWAHGDPNDPLWDSYDFAFGDRTALGPSEAEYELAMMDWGRIGHGPNAGLGAPDGLLAPVGAWVRRALRPQERVAGPPYPSAGLRAVPANAAMIPAAGAIKPSTYKVVLNGTTIIDGGEPVGNHGVVKVDLQLYGSTFELPAGSPLLHEYDPLNPTADNGGWNEMVATISDSTGHTTSVRARFPVMLRGPVQPLALAPMRDLTRESAADCAAFGAFQCGGVVITQGVPGYVSRDKERLLHLVYRSASQRGAQILPLRMEVDKYQAAPDSVHLRAKVDGVWTGDSIRYAGVSGSFTGTGVNNLWEGADEVRALGAELPAPTLATFSIRKAEIQVGQFYGQTLGYQAQLVQQEVVSAYLTDTTMTRFGSGWALAEQSRLFFKDSLAGLPAIVWLSGDGSYLTFTKVGGAWTAPTGMTAKLIDKTAAPESGAAWVISLSDGTRLGFKADAGSTAGLQEWAADLVNNKTTYTYSGARLTSIVDPTGGQFKFAYDAATPGQVARIYAKGPAQSDSTLMATLQYDAATRYLRRVDVWTSASQADSTLFGYLSGAPGAYLTTVTDPRSTSAAPIINTFSYDNSIPTVPPVQLTRPAPAGTGAGMFASFRDQWRRAVPRTGRGRNAQPLERMVHVSQLRGTYVSFDNRPTDYTVDAFNGPTWVRLIAPEPIFTFPFPPLPASGDVVRHIERDSIGRVVKIVSARDSLLIADSVMYQYDALSRVTTLIRNTAKYPILGTEATLDTVVFTYDSTTVSGTVATGGNWCSRLLKVRGVMGAADTTVIKYTGSGASKCLPWKTIGLAKDTTIFTYGSLAIGNSAATRPISIRDPNGLIQSATYSTANWNTLTYTKPGGGVTNFYYAVTGRPDSIRDPVGIPTRFLYDRLGRVTYQKAGTGALAPTTRSIFLPGGLVGEAQVYASSDANLTTATSVVQSTRTFYDRLGQVDSLIGPGQRSPAKEARKQSFERYSFGRPTYVYGGNGSLVGRMYDDQGRVKAQVQFPMSPSQPLGTEPFADVATTSFYTSLIMNVGPHLSAGQNYNFRYDNDGNVAEETGYDNFLEASPANRTRSYSRVGALVRDQVVYAGGLRVRRAYEYNRRGQRTLAADTVDLTGTGTISGDKLGWTRFVYDNATGRLDSMVVSVDTTGGVLTYGRTKWYFDKGGRDTLQVMILYPSNASSNKFQIKKVYKKASGLDSIYTVTQDSASKKWYEFTSPTYALNDELTAYTATEPGTTGTVSYAFKFAGDGTRRLVKSTRTPSAGSTTDTLKYDVFGNRSWELRNSTIFVDPGTCNNKADTLLYGADNRLLSRRKATPCSDFTTYYHDQAGNRIAQRDTLPVSPIVRTQKFTYTAANQLFFTLNATEALGVYNANWHWYDASGIRVMTHAQITNTWNASFAPDSGTRTFYFYDGSDVALSVSRSPTNQYWVGQRYMTGGLDRQLAGRFRAGATSFRQTLALVGDRQGSTVVAVRPGGTQESNTSFVVRGPFGTQEGAVTTGGINTQTGYTGASTPTQSGGFTYLRNRWYDPKTGRFLTQDPIGLAGGVNLYAYAGSNPISFSDPFGLRECPPNCAPGEGPAPTRQEIVEQATDNANLLIAAFTLLDGGLRIALGKITKMAVATPYGAAVQSGDPAALALRAQISRGQQVFRGGEFGTSTAAEGQFWAAESPLAAGFASRVGAATLGEGAPQFMLGGTVAADATFVTRTAPAVGRNTGGALEAVVPSGSVRLDFFHMP